MIHIDSFSTSIADLKKGQRTTENALKCLERDPTVSTFDMSENHTWLPSLIKHLELSGYIVSTGGEYPWHTYRITNKE